MLTNYSNQGRDPAAFIERQLTQSCADKKGWVYVVVSHNTAGDSCAYDEWLYTEAKRKPPKINR